jgi:hypothetical protein
VTSHRSSARSDLEARLRDHYGRTADRLVLDERSWDDVIAGQRSGPRSLERTTTTHRLVAASAVVLIGGGAVGAWAALAGDNDAPTGAPALVTSPSEDTLPLNVIIATPDDDTPFIACPEDPSLPADAATVVYPDDVRFNGMPLPVATPDGYCVMDHTPVLFAGSGSEATVWASCADCADPTAAIALIRGPSVGEPADEPGAESVATANGRGGMFVPRSASAGISRLYATDAGGAPILLAGWGLDRDGFLAFADAATTSGATLPGDLVHVYDGPAPALDALAAPANFSIGYAGSGSEWLTFSVMYDGTTWPEDTRLPLMALAWIAPDPVLSEEGDSRSIAFGPSPAPEGGGVQRSILVTSAPSSITGWVSTAETPLSTDELAAIPLSPAGPEDPRWIEIAYESGNSSAAG